MYRDREPRRMAPVKEGDELDVKIEAVGEKGDGIAKKQGFVLFIPKTKTGDEVRVRVTRVLKNAGFAEVIGDAVSKPAEPAHKPKKKEEEFEPDTANDSEDFGDEGEEPKEEAEEVAEKEEEPADEEQDEEEKNE